MKNRPVVIAGIGIGVAAIFALAAFIFIVHRAPIAAADAFLSQLGQGQVSTAYLATSATFRKTTTGNQFGRVVRRTGLDRYVSSTWNRNEAHDAQASLEGEFQLGGGKALPIKMELAKEDGAWHVLGFEVTGTAGPPELPPEREVVQLVGRAMHDFAEAVQARDFTAFHQTIARSWQDEVTPAEFATSFKEFFDERLDLIRLTDVEPTLDPRPSIDSDNALAVQGLYPTTPSQVHFRLRFVDESGTWKLIELSVRLVPLPPSLLPQPAVKPAPGKGRRK